VESFVAECSEGAEHGVGVDVEDALRTPER
jgi:hypothetical protein